MNIRTKISLIVLFVGAVFVVGGTTGVSYLSITNLQEQIQEKLETLTQVRASQVDVAIERDIALLKLITSRTSLRLNLDLYNKTGLDRYKKNIEDIVIDAGSSIDEFSEMSVIDLNGKVIVSTEDSELERDLSGEVYFNEGKESDSFNYFVEDESSGLPVIYLSGPLILNGDTVGVMVVELYADHMMAVVQDYLGIGKTEKAYVVDTNKNIIIPPAFGDGKFLNKKVDNENVRNCLNVLDASPEDTLSVYGSQDKTSLYNDFRAVSVLGSYYITNYKDWCIITEVDENEVFSPVNDVLNIFFISRIIILAVFFVIVYLSTKIVTDPIRDLQKGVEIVEKGDLDHKVGTKINDEIIAIRI